MTLTASETLPEVRQRTARSVVCSILGHDVQYLYPLNPGIAGNYSTYPDGRDCYALCKRCAILEPPMIKHTLKEKWWKINWQRFSMYMSFVAVGFALLNMAVTITHAIFDWCKL